MFLLKTCPLPGLTHWQINLISLPVQCLRPCEYCRLCAFLHFQIVILSVWFNLDMLFSLCTKKNLFSFSFYILHDKKTSLIFRFPAVRHLFSLHFVSLLIISFTMVQFLGHFSGSHHLLHFLFYDTFINFKMVYVSDTLFALTCPTLLAWLNAFPFFCFAPSVPHKYLINHAGMPGK